MLTVYKQDLEVVHEFYSSLRTVNGEARTIYEIWEDGGALGDSITPSTFCPQYQDHMLMKLQWFVENGNVLSIGCGNANVEAMLVKGGARVRAVDCMEEAVTIAISKGVEARVADFMQMQGHPLNDISVVYADGLVGHLFSSETGLNHFFKKLVDAGLKKGAYLVISNDGPRTRNLPYEKHPRVEDFWFLSSDYLAQALNDAGFQTLEAYTFPYVRPESGLCMRTICVARV